MTYDSIIIGKGLIGSAAAKYLSESEKKVAVVGPDEATALAQGIIFASHYDQARIQRIIGKDAVSTMLNQQSASSYQLLEDQTGIVFHSKEGCLYVNPYGTDDYLDQVPSLAARFNSGYRGFQNGKALHSFNGDFDFPPSAKGIFEPSPAGHINPRLLIRAQLEVFHKNGGETFNDTVTGVSYEHQLIRITTLSGKVFHSKKVLLAPGAFTNFLNLLETPLMLHLKSETTIWAKVTPGDAERLSSLPSLLYQVAEPGISDIYLVRPLKYPDGRYFLKMGANFPDDRCLYTLEDIRKWFQSGDSSSNLPVMQHALRTLLPGLSVEDWYTKRCIVSYTKHGNTYIGPVEQEGLFVAAGGNGYSAMSSDALGKIAARVVIDGQFPPGFSPKDFEPVFA